MYGQADIEHPNGDTLAVIEYTHFVNDLPVLLSRYEIERNSNSLDVLFDSKIKCKFSILYDTIINENGNLSFMNKSILIDTKALIIIDSVPIKEDKHARDPQTDQKYVIVEALSGREGRNQYGKRGKHGAIMLTSYAGLSQYDFFRIEFSCQEALDANPRRDLNVTIYNPDTTYVCCVELKVFNRNKTIKEYKTDTCFLIEKGDYNKIVEQTINLNSKQFFKDIAQREISIYTHPRSVRLTATFISGEEISFYACNPNTRTTERNLEQFLRICKEILLVANFNPNKYF